MKYKTGDKVRLKKETTAATVGNMREFLGKVVTIRDVTRGYYEFEEDHGKWAWDDRSIEGYANKNKIVITSDGVKTLARLYDGNTVIKTATAKCSPEDTFDFEEGARIAFDRLIEPPLQKSLRKFSEAVKNIKVPNFKYKAEAKSRKYKAGDKVKVIGDRSCHGMKKGEVVTLDRVMGDRAYSIAWFVKEYKDQWYIRECDFEPYTENKKPKYYNGKVVCVSNENKPYITVSGFTVGKVYTITDGIITSDNGWLNPLPMDNTLECVCACLGNKFIPFVE